MISKEDLITGSGVLKNNLTFKSYTIEELIKYTLVESDNTAYIKLLKYVGKEKIIKYGKSLGAIHTFEGKDSYGITNCNDMMVYWKELIKYIKSSKNRNKIKDYLLNPTVKYVKNDKYIRKYGEYDIAYHETGYVDNEKPYYLMILTQINKENYKEKFINKVANIIDEINNID